MSDELREVGRIGRPHGIHGELYVSLITDRTERLAPGAALHVAERTLVVAASRPASGRWVVRFEGVDDRTAAERLVNAVLRAEPLEDVDDDALWVHELIGARLVDQHGVDHGTCVAIVDNPAHDLIELDSGALVPVTFVVHCSSGIIEVDAPDGLFELDA